MLYTFGILALWCVFMSNHQSENTVKQRAVIDETRTMLSQAFTKRLSQLGISRREFVRRSGLSRQTLHNIEVEGRTDLAAATMAKLDEHLQWKVGTTHALANGDAGWLTEDAHAQEERAMKLRWQIVQHLSVLSLEDLETLVYQWDMGGE